MPVGEWRRDRLVDAQNGQLPFAKGCVDGVKRFDAMRMNPAHVYGQPPVMVRCEKVGLQRLHGVNGAARCSRTAPPRS